MTTNNLQGCRILLLRQAADSKNLIQQIKDSQGSAMNWSALEIVDNSALDPRQSLHSIESADIAIFVSKNAAIRSKLWVDVIRQKTVIAIGQGTQQSLSEIGLENIISPQKATSESLLELKQLHQVDKAKVVIFKGCGGRKLIQQELSSRGAETKELNLYQRRSQQMDANQARKIQSFKPNWIQITSEASAVSLDKANQRFKLFNNKDINILTVSKRLNDTLKNMGFNENNLFTANSIYNEDNIKLLNSASWKR